MVLLMCFLSGLYPKKAADFVEAGKKLFFQLDRKKLFVVVSVDHAALLCDGCLGVTHSRQVF